jgi:exosome complex RNA-binding protein Rrp4
MAGFQLSINGRIWVSTEEQRPRMIDRNRPSASVAIRRSSESRAVVMCLLVIADTQLSLIRDHKHRHWNESVNECS